MADSDRLLIPLLLMTIQPYWFAKMDNGRQSPALRAVVLLTDDTSQFNVRQLFFKMLKQLDRITFNPPIMAGQPCIRGMRIPVSLILNLMANDNPIEEILEEYPDPEKEDLHQYLLYASWLAREQVHRFELREQWG